MAAFLKNLEVIDVVAIAELLPVMTEFAEELVALRQKVVEWVEANPTVAQTVPYSQISDLWIGHTLGVKPDMYRVDRVNPSEQPMALTRDIINAMLFSVLCSRKQGQA